MLYTAGIHAPEWITSLLLIKFAQNLCNAFVSNSQIYGYDAKYLYENCSLYIIPMINPDGINLVNNFYSPTSEVYISANNIAKNYPDIPFPSGWKANINGVDLNSQFPANWELGKKSNLTLDIINLLQEILQETPLFLNQNHKLCIILLY